MKYIDTDKLIAEIEKRKEERQDIRDSASWKNEYWPESDFYIRDKEDDDILAIIDSLQQEMWKPSEKQMDCISCPRKTTGGFNTICDTSAATLHGNTSVTDGKEHNPSFTD